MEQSQDLPPTLIDLLSNAIILRQTIPLLAIQSLLRLTQTSKSLKHLLFSQPDTWRHLDLSPVKRAQIATSPIDVGGNRWRSQRMDEALCEDDFYAGPLRGVFASLDHRSVLGHVHTLVLDGLSVPADLVHDLLTDPRFARLRTLSLREARNLNHSKLQQALRYAVRPTRPEGTPRLRALYVFGPKDAPRTVSVLSGPEVAGALGVMGSQGAQIRAEWNHRSSRALDSLLADEQSKWYATPGRAMKRPLSEWPETLVACQGIIAFDAVLCRGPRHEIARVSSAEFLQPAIATVTLGARGCEICRSVPEGAARFGDPGDDKGTLPLLGPAPMFSFGVRGALRPTPDPDGRFPGLMARCEDCLRARWCEQCNRFWCEDCYVEPVSRLLVADVPRPDVRGVLDGAQDAPIDAQQQSRSVKVGVHRDCFTCGRTCEVCKHRFVRRCRNCTTEFCQPHDEGCSETEVSVQTGLRSPSALTMVQCGWCNSTGRRTRELY